MAEAIRILTLMCALVPTSTAISFICSERRMCGALVGYKSRDPTTLGAIQRLFNVTSVADILAANDLPEGTVPDNFMVEETRVTRIPFECNCTQDGHGHPTNPPIYTVGIGANLSYIATTVFWGLVDSRDILYENNLINLDSLMVGQGLRVPLPCNCGMNAVHMGLTLEYGSTVEQIAHEYHIDPNTIWTLNRAADPNLLLGKALDIPLPVCSTMVRNDSLDHPLLVPNGSYVYTANGCVRCNCNAANNWTLSCEPSKLKPTNWSTCPSMQCHNSSKMYIGDTTYSSSHNLTICAYAGYGTKTIFTTLAAVSIPPGLVHAHDATTF